MELAERRNLPIRIHPKGTLARISKNARQDQGVALDVRCPKYETATSYLSKAEKISNIVAIENITNPKNVGIILRSAVAAGISGLIYPRHNSPRLGPLVIQASAGAAFRAPIIWCDNLKDTLGEYASNGFQIVGLDPSSKNSLFDMIPPKRAIYILGGESEGISSESEKSLTQSVSIPMSGLVESLNVAVAGSLLSYFITHRLESRSGAQK